jgi:hypothetical protein
MNETRTAKPPSTSALKDSDDSRATCMSLELEVVPYDLRVGSRIVEVSGTEAVATS